MILEVGKKYWTRDKGQIIKIIYDRSLELGERKIRQFLAITVHGDLLYYWQDGKSSMAHIDEDIHLDLIEEYKEPIKKSVTGFIVFNPEGEPSENEAIDLITGLDTNGYIYSNKEELDPDRNFRKETIYGRFTFEELPEPKKCIY